MSHATLHAVLDNGEGLPDCPTAGDNLYVYPAIVPDLDTGVEFCDSTLLLCCHFCRDPTFFYVDDDFRVVAQTPSCPCCSSNYTRIIPKQEPTTVADEATSYGYDDCPAIFWLEDGEYVSN